MTSSWDHWHVPSAMSPLRMVVTITGSLYAAAGLLFGWLIHNLFGSTPLRSRVLRALPLLFALAALPQIFVVPGIAPLALRLSTALMRSPFLVMDFVVLAVLWLVLITLLILEWRRARAGTLRTT